MNGTIRKIQLAVGTVALVATFLVGLGGHAGILDASAQTISTTTDGWTRENFASSCKAAGGRVVEIDQGDIKYSKCYFSDGSVNKCDWIKKICTFGFEVGPAGGRVGSTSGTLTTAGTGSGGPTAGTRQTVVGTSGVAADD